MKRILLTILSVALLAGGLQLATSGQQPLIQPIYLKLADVTDVATTAPTDNYVLKYDAATGLWGPEASSSGISDTLTLTDGTDPHILKAVDETGLGGRLTFGLDETARTLVICDYGDVDSDLALAVAGNPSVYLFDADKDSYLSLGWDTDDVPKLEVGGSASKLGIYSDLFTDRWLEQDSNTFVGVGVAGAGNLAHGGGYEGYYNSFFGTGAGYAITLGYQNSFFGRNAGYANTTGYFNSFFGLDAARSNTTGNGNSSFGRDAGRYQNDGTTALQTPEDSVYLGYSTKSGSDPAGGEDAIDNEIVIGYGATGNGSDTVTLGNTSVTKTYLAGTATASIGYNYAAETTATPSAAFTVDWTAKHVQRVTITGTNLDVTFTDPSGPCRLCLVVVQGDGDDTIDWANEASILWPGGVDPTLSTTSGYVDVITYYFDGVSYHGVASYDFR